MLSFSCSLFLHHPSMRPRTMCAQLSAGAALSWCVSPEIWDEPVLNTIFVLDHKCASVHVCILLGIMLLLFLFDLGKISTHTNIINVLLQILYFEFSLQWQAVVAWRSEPVPNTKFALDHKWTCWPDNYSQGSMFDSAVSFKYFILKIRGLTLNDAWTNDTCPADDKVLFVTFEQGLYESKESKTIILKMSAQ